MLRDVILDDNGVQVQAGHKITWRDVGGEKTGEVEFDVNYSDNLRVGQASLRSVYDESDSLIVIN